MAENSIKIKNKNKGYLKLELETEEGIKTGEFLEFDLNDIELPLKLQEIIEKSKKNKQILRNKLMILKKRPDKKGKKLFSANEEEAIRLTKEFFLEEKKLYNEFLGENGVEKILNGQKFGWDSLDMIDDVIIEGIAPYLDLTLDNMIENVKEKYNKAIESNVLKVDDINE